VSHSTRSPQLNGTDDTVREEDAAGTAPPERDADTGRETDGEPSARTEAGAEGGARADEEPRSGEEPEAVAESPAADTDAITQSPAADTEAITQSPAAGAEPEAGDGTPATDKTQGTPEAETPATDEPQATPAAETPATDEPQATPAAETPATDEPQATPAAAADADVPGEVAPRARWRQKHPEAARALAWTVTGLALALVLFGLLVPNDIARLKPAAFVRIPAEGVLGAALLLVLPPRARRIAAVVAGVVLGLLTILKFLDMGFYWTLDRPFDLVLDWILLDDAQSFLKDSIGGTGALLATIGVIALVVAVLVLMTLSVVRLSRLMVRNRHTAGRTLLVLGTAWITCSTLTLDISGVPLASHSAATLVEHRVDAVRQGLKDGEAFKKQAAIDAFANTPPDQLLTGLRGKDVLITFIESYGRSAIEDPQMAGPMNETLTQKTKELDEAGFASRSGWLRSPITGAGSWLGHSTFLSGLWIKNQQRYRNLTSGDRLTLTEAFRRTGAWRTVGIVPGTQKAWPEGKYFGLDHIYDAHHLGYKGPKFSWSTMPDQYTLKTFEKLEHGKKHNKPMMAEIILTSSHNPWAPIPSTIPEDQIGNGSVYYGLQKAEGKDPKDVWKNASDVRDEYRKSIQYSVTSLVDYVKKYGSKNTVLIFLGDHQPNKTVTGEKPNHDVPVSIVAQDPKVLDKIADWGWTDGLKPASDAPEWRMDKFRDRFMTAFGSTPSS